ncbi:hypothetical protein UFOVP520_3 [uncultured Caudovirales phage]|uniref:Uncharacterized protein n=1 Tax=uncultured Caudovirales phage TaxID=2100421 RepID=A0A6J5MN52_9CAUD|nr:hypothetical protein UFOVP520_3 [uncultured Caudovirales phage]
MKVDLNFDLSELDGTPAQGINLGKIIAGSLVQQTKGDALKYWDWAVALNKGEALELDSSDQQTITTFVKENENLTIYVKAQFLLAMKK